jgi:hypothetical protein
MTEILIVRYGDSCLVPEEIVYKDAQDPAEVLAYIQGRTCIVLSFKQIAAVVDAVRSGVYNEGV